MKVAACVYLNIETRRTAGDVGGWYPEKLRISIAVAVTKCRLHVFTAHDTQRLMFVLESARCIVGWNIKGFDFKVLSGYPEVNFARVRCLDLVAVVEKAVGARAALSAVSAATLRTEAEPNSLEMVKLWGTGKVAQVIEGCCNTSLTLKAIHERGCCAGEVFYCPPGGKRRKRLNVNWAAPR